MFLPVNLVNVSVVTGDQMKVLASLKLEKAAQKLFEANVTLSQELLFLLEHLDILVAVEAQIAIVAITTILIVWCGQICKSVDIQGIANCLRSLHNLIIDVKLLVLMK